MSAICACYEQWLSNPLSTCSRSWQTSIAENLDATYCAAIPSTFQSKSSPSWSAPWLDAELQAGDRRRRWPVRGVKLDLREPCF
jgi:hypothetical protein